MGDLEQKINKIICKQTWCKAKHISIQNIARAAELETYTHECT